MREFALDGLIALMIIISNALLEPRPNPLTAMPVEELIVTAQTVEREWSRDLEFGLLLGPTRDAERIVETLSAITPENDRHAEATRLARRITKLQHAESAMFFRMHEEIRQASAPPSPD